MENNLNDINRHLSIIEEPHFQIVKYNSSLITDAEISIKEIGPIAVKFLFDK